MPDRLFPFTCPVDHRSAWITRLHGVRPDIYAPWGTPEGHNGVDIAGPAGIPVKSMLEGIVVQAGELARNGPLGITVITWHRRLGLLMLYAHLQEALVEAGQGVPGPGKPIGRLGSTGTNSTGCHLHVSVARVIPGRDPERDGWRSCIADRDDGHLGWSIDALRHWIYGHPPVTDEALAEAGLDREDLAEYQGLPQFHDFRKIDGVWQQFDPQTGEHVQTYDAGKVSPAYRTVPGAPDSHAQLRPEGALGQVPLQAPIPSAAEHVEGTQSTRAKTQTGVLRRHASAAARDTGYQGLSIAKKMVLMVSLLFGIDAATPLDVIDTLFAPWAEARMADSRPATGISGQIEPAPSPPAIPSGGAPCRQGIVGSPYHVRDGPGTGARVLRVVPAGSVVCWKHDSVQQDAHGGLWVQLDDGAWIHAGALPEGERPQLVRG